MCRAFVAQCEDNAIKAPVSRGLPTPEHSGTIKTWEDMYQTCLFVHKYKDRYSALIVDGFSIFSSNLYKQAQETIGKSSKNKFDVPVFVRTKLIEFRGWLRDIGLHSVLVAHPVQPAVQDDDLLPRRLLRHAEEPHRGLLLADRHRASRRLRVPRPGRGCAAADAGHAPTEPDARLLHRRRGVARAVRAAGRLALLAHEEPRGLQLGDRARGPRRVPAVEEPAVREAVNFRTNRKHQGEHMSAAGGGFPPPGSPFGAPPAGFGAPPQGGFQPGGAPYPQGAVAEPAFVLNMPADPNWQPIEGGDTLEKDGFYWGRSSPRRCATTTASSRSS